MQEERGGQSAAEHRLIVLGASNVRRAISTLLATSQKKYGKRTEIFLAAGHGRSYGNRSQVLGRALPGILDCALWKALHSAPSIPTSALITDIGNDLLYGASVDAIIGWVRCCLERLRPLCEQINITEIPLASVASIGHLRYRIFRAIFFPRCSLLLPELIRRAEGLNSGIIDLAREYKAQIVSPCPDWYGIDPIHILKGREAEAWQRLLHFGEGEGENEPLKRSLARSFSLFCARPYQRWLLGWEQRCEQPARRYSDGASVALY